MTSTVYATRVLGERTARRARMSARPVPQARPAWGVRDRVPCAQLECTPTKKEATPALPAPLAPTALPALLPHHRVWDVPPGPSPTPSLVACARRAVRERSARGAPALAPSVRREPTAPGTRRSAPYVRRVPLAARERPLSSHALRDPTTPILARADASRAPPGSSPVWRERHLAVPGASSSLPLVPCR